MVGFVIGTLGRLVAPGRRPVRIWLTVVTGILGAFAGIILARIMGFGASTSGLDLLVLLVQVVVAALAVVVVANLDDRSRQYVAPRPPAPFARTARPQPVTPTLPPSRSTDRDDLFVRPDDAVPVSSASRPQQSARAPASPTPPPPPPSRIFVSYRRSDSAFAARGIAERLRGRFGNDDVFIDVDSLEAGADFVAGVLEAIRGSAAVLVLIGDRWLAAADDQGVPRLSDPTENVRIEIESALHANRPMLPVLLAGTAMPRPDQLPRTMQALSRVNGVRIDHESWDDDVARLIQAVARRRP